MRLLVAQVDVIPDREKQVERVFGFLERFRGAVDIIALPELWTTGYRLKEEKPHTDIKVFSEFARHMGAYLVAGSIYFREGEKYFNRSFVFDREGTLIGEYTKIHLFRSLDEVFTAGEIIEAIPTEFGKIGVIICYDIRFPELARKLMLKGAEVLFVPAHWPHARIDHWNALLKARAIENQMYVVGVNRYGREGDILFGGNSGVYSPRGELVGRIGSGEGYLLVELNLEELRKYRKEFPVLEDAVLLNKEV